MWVVIRTKLMSFAKKEVILMVLTNYLNDVGNIECAEDIEQVMQSLFNEEDIEDDVDPKDYTFTFGKYNGMAISVIFEDNPGYLKWYLDNGDPQYNSYKYVQKFCETVDLAEAVKAQNKKRKSVGTEKNLKKKQKK